MKLIYLDVCCLNRPFDSQSQERIKLESEAIILIFKHIETNDWQWVSSEVVDFEVEKIPNLERKYRIQSDSESIQNQRYLREKNTEKLEKC